MKTWFGIRHIRWMWHSFWFDSWWANYGQYAGAVPHPLDLQHLENIWEGRA